MKTGEEIVEEYKEAGMKRRCDLYFIRLRRRPRLRAVTPIEKDGQGWYFGVQARTWPWRNALM